MQRLIQRLRLRYWVAVACKLGPATAIVVYWAELCNSIRDEAVIFSAADLGLPELANQNKYEPSRPNNALQGSPGLAPGIVFFSCPLNLVVR
ncbi:hypothetical protein A6X21_04820 [Planctopirus hydrillae]|uniref:Uncharacterized protein n=1 Tax=Planctopirus hydrillae TaxID=1841610 RepID=A0A1C3ENY2_9PLAN|nr:hypothetical protein A6X21_04820 [Planctopirus hydrillae]